MTFSRRAFNCKSINCGIKCEGSPVIDDGSGGEGGPAIDAGSGGPNNANNDAIDIHQSSFLFL